MGNLKIKISDHPDHIGKDRHLDLNTVVYKYKELVPYALVIFDVIYSKNGLPVKDMAEGLQKQFVVSTGNFVDSLDGMKITPDLIEDGKAYNYDENGLKTEIPNSANQFIFFKTLVDNKIKTEKELIIEFVEKMDLVQFFD